MRVLYFFVVFSVTRWLDYFFNFWPFTTMKVCHFDEMFVEVGRLQFCQILNKPSKDCQKVLKFCQSGEISPNLVTVVALLHCSKSYIRHRFLAILPNDVRLKI